MRRKNLFPGLFVFAILLSIFSSPELVDVRAASPADQKVMVLYDATSGAVPSESLMVFTDFPPGAASLGYADGASVMDTTASGSDTFAGWVSSRAATPGFPALDRAAGFQVNFILQVASEIHDREHRAGFSVIVLDQEARGVELAFWEDQVWVQNDASTGGLFTHGEGTLFAATDPVEYQLAIIGDTYTLSANSQPILSGPVRDYRPFEGFPDPYETPNFLFLGDDTTAARSEIRLSYLSIASSDPVSPTVAVTDVSTAAPLPTASSTPIPSITPVSTPVPPRKGIGLCPSGGLIFVVVLTNAVFLRARRRTKMLQ